jgi:hypothetical protein
MPKQSKKIDNKYGKLVGNQWLYLLPSPFRMQYAPSLPLSADDIAANLNMSYPTALRICQNKRPLKPFELIYLQIVHFGMIPDKAFIKSKFFVYDGKLRCHNVSNYELSTGELYQYTQLRVQVLRLNDVVADTKERLLHAEERIKELEEPPKPTNIIRFSDYIKKE